MARSNFDYSNRASSGIKLGAIIASDLVKRATRKNQGDKKTSAPRRAGKCDQQKIEGGRSEASKVDIRAPEKQLGDDGFSLLATGLETALQTCHELALVDLNVSNNGLTTRSLARMAPIISRAHFDMQILNLSGNNIQVASEQQAHEWEIFMASLSQCRSLRHLDLSSNVSLGHWALEIMAKMYARERPVDPLPAHGSVSVLSLLESSETNQTNADECGDENDTSKVHYGSDISYTPNGDHLAQGCILEYRRGLRSIPYLTLQNIGLTDTGALFLSSIVEQHFYPVQLIDGANATEACNKTRLHRQDIGSEGLDWERNELTMGRDGIQLLRKAKKVRMYLMVDGTNLEDSVTTDGYTLIGSSDLRDSSSSCGDVTLPRRRTSIVSQRSTDGVTELEHARKKVQRNAIIQYGHAGIKLWHAAMIVFKFSRHMSLLVPSRRALSAVSTASRGRLFMLHHDFLDGIAMPCDISSQLINMSMDGPLSTVQTLDSRPSYAATLSASTSGKGTCASTALSDITIKDAKMEASRDDNTIPVVEGKRAAYVDKHAKTSLSQMPPSVTARVDMTSKYLKWQRGIMLQHQEQADEASDGYRDTRLRCHLPLPLCVRILAHAVEAETLASLSERQQKKAFEWGQLHESLMVECDWRNKDESSQIWMLLDAVDCLAYE